MRPSLWPSKSTIKLVERKISLWFCNDSVLCDLWVTWGIAVWACLFVISYRFHFHLLRCFDRLSWILLDLGRHKWFSCINNITEKGKVKAIILLGKEPNNTKWTSDDISNTSLSLAHHFLTFCWHVRRAVVDAALPAHITFEDVLQTGLTGGL